MSKANQSMTWRHDDLARDLFSWLSAHHWIYRRPGGAGWLGYQDKAQRGRLAHKVATG